MQGQLHKICESYICEILCLDNLEHVNILINRHIKYNDQGVSIDSYLYHHDRLRYLLAINHLFTTLYGMYIPRLYAKQIIDTICIGDSYSDLSIASIDRATASIVSALSHEYTILSQNCNKIKLILNTFLSDLAKYTINNTEDCLNMWLLRYSDSQKTISRPFILFTKHLYPYLKNRIESYLVNPITLNTLEWTTYKRTRTLYMYPYESELDVALYMCVKDTSMFNSVQNSIVILITNKDVKLISTLLGAIKSIFNKQIVIVANKDIHKEIKNQYEYVAMINHDDQMVVTLCMLPLKLAKKVIYIGQNSNVINTISNLDKVIWLHNVNSPSGLCDVSLNRFNSSHQYIVITDDSIVSKQCLHQGIDFLPWGVSIIDTTIIKDSLQFFLTDGSCTKKTITYKYLFHIYILNFKGKESLAKPDSSKKCIVMIDNRKNGLSLLCIYVTLANLKANHWNVVIITSTASKDFYMTHIGHVATVCVHDALDVDQFNVNALSEFMKTKKLWELLIELDYKHCLTIQDDGCVIRPGIEVYLESVIPDYVGAPWSRLSKDNIQLALMIPNLVGNGGVSWRSINKCLCITETSYNASALFLYNLIKVPEDVFFAKEFHERGDRVPDHDVAKLFSSEQILHNSSFCFHKIWNYHSYEAIVDFFKDIL